MTTQVIETKETRGEDLARRIDSWISAATASKQMDIHEKALENWQYVGQQGQWREGDIERQKRRERPHMPMDQTNVTLNAASNREIMNRFEPRVHPREPDDEAMAEGWDEAVRWQRDTAFVDHVEGIVFRSMMVTGYGVGHQYYDPLERDGEGLVLTEDIPVWDTVWDPSARRQNLRDRRWNLRGKIVGASDLRHQFGLERHKKFSTKSSENISSRGSGQLGWSSASEGEWYDEQEDTYFLVEAEWRDVKHEWKISLPAEWEWVKSLWSGDEQALLAFEQEAGFSFSDLPPEEALSYLEGFLENQEVQVFPSFKDAEETQILYGAIYGQSPRIVRDTRHSYRTAAYVDGEIIDQREIRGYTYHFMTGVPIMSREGTEYLGLVDYMKGPQDWRNSLMSLILVRLAHSPKQSLVVEEGAVDDIDRLRDELANPAGAAVVPDGFFSAKKYEFLNQQAFPRVEDSLIRIAGDGILEQAGLSGIDVGQQGDLRRISGNVVSAAREASNTILALYFDSLQMYRKDATICTIRLMGQTFDRHQLRRIMGNEKADGVSQSVGWEDFRKADRIDIIVEQQQTSVSEMNEFYDLMTRTGTLEKWLDQDRIPFSFVVDKMPWFSKGDKRVLHEHEARRDMTNQLLGFLQQSEEGMALLEQFQQQSGQPTQ